MKRTDWIPIATPPIRDGEYNVRDSRGQIARWLWNGLPGGDGNWWTMDAILVTQLAPDLMWCGLTDEIWTCKDGRQMPVFEMDGEHAKNALRMILRKQRELIRRARYE